MANSSSTQTTHITLDQIKPGDDGPIVVMICRKWDVHNINGKYLSTDFVISDEKGSTMHATMKSNISHCFGDKVVEGSVVSMRSFAVEQRNEYRIFKDDRYLIELNGSTVVRKSTANPTSFVRHPFDLVDFDDIKETNGKYLIDVIGCILDVCKPGNPRTGSKTLVFSLTNESGKMIRVTLWGKLGDNLLKMIAGHTGNYTLILTSMSAKHFQGQLGISSSSATLILSNDDIPAIQSFKTKISMLGEKPTILPVSNIQPQNGTILALLTLGRDKHNESTTLQIEAEIVGVRTKNSWYYLSCGSGKCKKGVTRNDGQLWCDSCETSVTYPKPRFRLEVEVKDGTGQMVVVLWDETATQLTNSSAKALLDEIAEVDDDAPMLPCALINLCDTKHIFEVKSHTYYHLGDFESFTCTKVFPRSDVVNEVGDGVLSADGSSSSGKTVGKSPLKRLIRGPQTPSPCKKPEPNKKRRYIQDISDTEDEGVEITPRNDNHEGDDEQGEGYD